MIPKSMQRFSEKIMRKQETSQRAKALCASAALSTAGRAGTF
jgi:hypothetical protein